MTRWDQRNPSESGANMFDDSTITPVGLTQLELDHLAIVMACLVVVFGILTVLRGRKHRLVVHALSYLEKLKSPYLVAFVGAVSMYLGIFLCMMRGRIFPAVGVFAAVLGAQILFAALRQLWFAGDSSDAKGTLNDPDELNQPPAT
ncbi:Uncharacterized protein MLTONO_7551 [Mesorhizobium loti]|nr:Uncharacterized protein MLTONO_7551 [Mesorhizobium loti]